MKKHLPNVVIGRIHKDFSLAPPDFGRQRFSKGFVFRYLQERGLVGAYGPIVP